MRRQWLLLWALVLFPLSAFAQEIEVVEAGLTLKMPQGFHVLVAGEADTAPGRQALGLSPEASRETDAFLTASHITATALHPDFTDEFMVICLPQSQAEPIRALDEAQAAQVGRELAEAADYSALGLTDYAFTGVAQGGGLWWYLMEGISSAGETPAYLRQYATLWQGQTLSLTWHSYDGPLTPAEAAAHDAALASVHKPPTPGAYVRYDSPEDALCVTFTLPQGYTQLPDREGKLLRTRFANAGGQGFAFDYGDLVPQARKTGLPWAKEPRTLLDTARVWGEEAPAPQAFAALTGLTPDPSGVRQTQVDGALAWIAQGRASGEPYGLGGEAPALACAWVQNGLAITLIFYNMPEAEAEWILASLAFLRLPH